MHNHSPRPSSLDVAAGAALPVARLDGLARLQAGVGAAAITAAVAAAIAGGVCRREGGQGYM